jgi:dienelactone hydrolase
MVDPPGSGEALRLRGLTSRVDSEAWATACVDYLETRDDVDPTRIGLVGWSLGGYCAPRAAAFEKRLALSSRGAPTTTGVPCSGAGCNARVSGRFRTTGNTCCGCGVSPTTPT